jgi:hypothetical protein
LRQGLRIRHAIAQLIVVANRSIGLLESSNLRVHVVQIGAESSEFRARVLQGDGIFCLRDSPTRRERPQRGE